MEKNQSNLYTINLKGHARNQNLSIGDYAKYHGPAALGIITLLAGMVVGWSKVEMMPRANIYLRQGVKTTSITLKQR